MISGDRAEAREFLMSRRMVMAVVLTGLLATGALSNAHAQQPASAGQQVTAPSGWIFNVAPYLWTANLNTTTSLNLPPAAGGGTVTSTTSLGFDELLQHLNSAVMVTGDAQYNQFSILTDYMYMNLGGTAAQFKSVNFSGLPHIPI